MCFMRWKKRIKMNIVGDKWLRVDYDDNDDD